MTQAGIDANTDAYAAALVRDPVEADSWAVTA